MVYPRNFESKIGFDNVREMLKNYCLSNSGKRYIDKIHFSDNFELINKLISQTEEFRQVLLFEGKFPEQDYFDLTQELLRISIKGTFIEIEALFNLKSSLSTISECLSFIGKLKDEKYPFLKEISKNVHIDNVLLKRINEVIDEKGKIKDTASPQLQSIRKDLIQKKIYLDKKVVSYVNSFRKQSLIPENEQPTVRNGRTVIPINVSDKRKVKGIIQDESASGQTVFIEPDEIIDINNDIRSLEYEEKHEIIRILISLSDFIRPHIDELTNSYRFLGMIDFIRAKAKFAIETESLKPHILNETVINWAKAKHPLLILSHKNRKAETQNPNPKTKNLESKDISAPNSQLPTKKEVVPNEFYLNKKQRILIISGPNAGGKSVCLKTVGILQYMLQCGLLVSMAEQSDAGIFKKLFIDIGDEQSIENDLSTYSSHLLNIKFFISNADSRTLFLIDEFGAGTEPQLGGAIAESALEEINQKKAFGIITTHYTNLKILADKTNGLINGSMFFDTKKLQPTYKLKIGIMGSSYAFEIAKKIGFQKEVLKNAELKIGTTHVSFEKQLSELETKKTEVEKKEKEFRVADDVLAEYINKYKMLYEELEASKKKIINEAKLKAEEIVSNSNKVIERTIKEIKESQADREKTKISRENIKSFSDSIRTEDSSQLKTQNSKVNRQPSSDNRKTQNPKPQIRNPKPQAQNLKTQNPKPQTQNPKPGTPNPEPQTRNPKLKTRNSEPKTHSPKASTPSPFQTGDLVRPKGKTAVGEVMNVYENDALVAFNSFNMTLPFKELEIVRQKNTTAKPQNVKIKSNIDLNEKVKNFKTVIDVRGSRAEEAISLIDKYIDDAILLRIREIRIIHGKGNGILRQVIREFLMKVQEIKDLHDEPVEKGGDGVTIVRFKD